MPLPKYTYTGPVDHTIPPDLASLRGKSVIVTGGANGIGEACVRHFALHGAFITIGDINEARGKSIEEELNWNGPCCVFVKCDIREWDEQKHMFDVAKAKSPSNSVDVVIANAGVGGIKTDQLWKLGDPDGEPVKPDLGILNTNLEGTLYTWKLAVHYFRKQPEEDGRDRCFIITGSMVAWIDTPLAWQYTVSKYGLRGLMRTARWSTPEHGIRINYVAPWWVKSAIRTPKQEAGLVSKGVEFAEPGDAASCMMRIATDRDINGRSLMVMPRGVVEQGFMDVDRDDYTDKEEDKEMKLFQMAQLKIIDEEWREE